LSPFDEFKIFSTKKYDIENDFFRKMINAAQANKALIEEMTNLWAFWSDEALWEMFGLPIACGLLHPGAKPLITRQSDRIWISRNSDGNPGLIYLMSSANG
jgi:hypothetical protein